MPKRAQPTPKPIEKPFWNRSKVKIAIISASGAVMAALITAIFTFVRKDAKEQSSAEIVIGTNNGKIAHQDHPSNSPIIMGDENNYKTEIKKETTSKPQEPNISLIAVPPASYATYVGKNKFLRSDSLFFLFSIKNVGTGDAYNLIDESDCFMTNKNKSYSDKYFWVGQNDGRTFSKNQILKPNESLLIPYPFPTRFIDDTLYFYFKLQYSNEKGKKKRPIETVVQFDRSLIESNLPFAQSKKYDEILEWVTIFNKRHRRFLNTKKL